MNYIVHWPKVHELFISLSLNSFGRPIFYFHSQYGYKKTIFLLIERSKMTSIKIGNYVGKKWQVIWDLKHHLSFKPTK